LGEALWARAFRGRGRCAREGSPYLVLGGGSSAAGPRKVLGPEMRKVRAVFVAPLLGKTVSRRRRASAARGEWAWHRKKNFRLPAERGSSPGPVFPRLHPHPANCKKPITSERVLRSAPFFALRHCFDAEYNFSAGVDVVGGRNFRGGWAEREIRVSLWGQDPGTASHVLRFREKRRSTREGLPSTVPLTVPRYLDPWKFCTGSKSIFVKRRSDAEICCLPVTRR